MPSTQPPGSVKRLAISKANAQMVIVVGVASFITVFCLIASKAVFSQTRYQARITTAKEQAHQQLQDNIQTYSKLAASYKAFDSASTNVIGGNLTGTGDNDGSNSKIILDALPSTYDFPALTSSIEKVLAENNVHVTAITGTDDELSQQNNKSSPNPKPVSMPFSFTVSGASYTSVAQLVNRLQQSIRPIQIDTIELSGSSSNMTLTVQAHTYYQPGKNVTITKKVVR